MITVLKSNITNVTVTETKNFIRDDSCQIDENLMSDANIRNYEQIEIINKSNHKRFVTMATSSIFSGNVCLTGSAAFCGSKGDNIEIRTYEQISNYTEKIEPVFIDLDKDNQS
jgi:aspartate 1-decarboxylase